MNPSNSASFSQHIALDVLDRSTAVEFYRDILGMGVVDVDEEETVLSCGDVRFYVMESEEPAVYLEFSVPNLESFINDCDAAGCETDEVSTPELDTSYYVTDPFGTTFHVFESDDA